jgi:hypothetical protein
MPQFVSDGPIPAAISRPIDRADAPRIKVKSSASCPAGRRFRRQIAGRLPIASATQQVHGSGTSARAGGYRRLILTKIV